MSTRRNSSPLEVVQLGPHLGAEIRGADLTHPVSDADFQVIHEAFVKHELLLFRNQPISQDDQVRFAGRFGELTIHPFSASLPTRPEIIVLDNDKDNPPLSTDQWHSDEMFREEPPLATMLVSKIVPPYGGDTLFASMTAAHDGLSDNWRSFLSDLYAEFDFKVFRALFSGTTDGRKKLLEIEEMFPNPIHPVVRVHPVTGRKAIYVSPQATKRILGMTAWESDHLLDMLYHLAEIPEYQFRVQWEPNMVVLWDNRSTQHYATRDYLAHRRRMERVTIRGDRPYGVTGERRSTAELRAMLQPLQEDRTRIKRDELARPFERTAKAAG
jgi:taurine dioxygenase